MIQLILHRIIRIYVLRRYLRKYLEFLREIECLLKRVCDEKEFQR